MEGEQAAKQLVGQTLIARAVRELSTRCTIGKASEQVQVSFSSFHDRFVWEITLADTALSHTALQESLRSTEQGERRPIILPGYTQRLKRVADMLCRKAVLCSAPRTLPFLLRRLRRPKAMRTAQVVVEPVTQHHTI